MTGCRDAVLCSLSKQAGHDTDKRNGETFIKKHTEKHIHNNLINEPGGACHL